MPHAFELASMVATIGNQNNLRDHAGEPPWHAMARLRARLDGGYDWQPELDGGNDW